MPVMTMKQKGPIGHGAQRAVAFGGGGEWFVAWMVGYAQGLLKEGVDLSTAEITIGTSAGAIVGAAIKGGRLDQLSAQLQEISSNPALAAVGGVV